MWKVRSPVHMSGHVSCNLFYTVYCCGWDVCACVYSVFLTWQVVTFFFITCSLDPIMYQPVQFKVLTKYSADALVEILGFPVMHC